MTSLLTPGVLRFAETLRGLRSTPVAVAYLCLIPLSIGWQKTTKPRSLRKTLVVYNLLCSVLSLYSFAAFAYGVFFISPSWFHKAEVNALKHVFLLYWITKNLELWDTIFMVLRHRRRQMSFLHVYHHTSILLLSDFCYHHYPWAAMAVPLGLNSLVHVFLYLYYGLSAAFPDKPLPWKRRVTELQIVQFFIGLVHSSLGYLYHGFCIYGIGYGLSMVALFSNFYYRAYLQKQPVNQGKKTS
ncbi:PREDICTED: elongation of very long chain fatty acids protein 5-like [Branchiostoma belcheri]|uniref:Elongation of very long chain fatty acids protein n=1 Tax=Branchiostoma belcheri TaxID=7741 RepID=A0A6P5ACI5_BRABE|nr:PREDICTED: elongation of very long chain fatty acids protein 5-like [Branchiostoma belcheri]